MIRQEISLKDREGKQICVGDTVQYADKYKYIVCFGEYNVNPENCAEAIIVGFYLKDKKTGETESLYSINGVGARFPAHCAESEKGLEGLKLKIV